MAFESTAINDLVAGLQRKALPSEEEDWLFGERDSLFREDATQIDPRRMDPSPLPVASQGSAPLQLPAQGAALRVPAQSAPLRMPALAIDAMDRSRSPTTYVRSTDWLSIAKKLALPIGLASIVVVLLGVYFAKSETTKQATPVAAVAEQEAPAAAPEPPAPTPVVTPIVTPIEDSPKAEPPTATAPIAEAAQPQAAPAQPQAAPEAAQPQAAPAAEPPKAEPPKAEPPKAEPPKPEAPKAEAPPNIEPGSPASRFLSTTAEPTIPTVPTTTSKPAPAPAPTVAPDMPAPKQVAAATEELGVTVVGKKKPKKSARQLRAEKRAAAKRAVKASLAKARTKRSAVAEDEAEDEAEADEAPPKPAKPEKSVPAAKEGKGTLSIASTPAMEVWVDGRNSKAMTPVRVILLAGKHKVTLFDKENAKARSFDIEIKPGETTKVVKNYE